MKKFVLLAISTLFSISSFGAWITSVNSGDWTDGFTWNAGEEPNATYDGINIGQNTSVDITTDVANTKAIFIKPNAKLVLREGGTFNQTNSSVAFDGAGCGMVFLGGKYVTSTQLNQNNGGSYWFGGEGSDGAFHAAAAKSIESSNRLQFRDGTTNFNLGASNLISEKSTGMDDNAIAYTTGEIQMIQNEFNFDFSNIILGDLYENGITESGTYYVALASFGVTYKSLGSAEFTPVLGTAEDSEFVSFAGFEWANETNRNNTLYAVLDITIPPSIPEPSTYAAVFGAIALAFAAHRVRK